MAEPTAEELTFTIEAEDWSRAVLRLGDAYKAEPGYCSDIYLCFLQLANKLEKYQKATRKSPHMPDRSNPT